MKAINIFKKGMAVVLSTAMILGLAPVMPGNVLKVQAAENTPKIILYDVDLSGDESKGDIVDIGGERFYVTKIGTTDITCFAVKGLSIEDNRQSDNPDLVRFSGSAYSSYNGSEVKQYTDKYGAMLNEEYGLDAVVGLEGYGDIGYVAPYAYSASIYAEKTWYQNGNYWTSSTYRNYGAWKVSGNFLNAVPGDSNTAMVRPAVTFAKSKINEIVKDVTSVAITDLDAPIAGRALDTDAISDTEGVNKIEVTWTSDHEVSEDEKLSAKYNTSYTAEITVRAGNGYIFTSATDVVINAETCSGEIKDNGKTLVVTSKTFWTEKDKLISIVTPNTVTVANGTTYSDIKLPSQVDIVTEGDTVVTADVSWDTSLLENGGYDPLVLTEQKVTLKGMVICPDDIDVNGVALTTEVTVVISAAGVAGVPSANVQSGTYAENQTVTLSSFTDGADIYYTTDGSKPSKTNGTRYVTPISVTGTEGQSVVTTIKAIAVMDGMQDSEVQTFIYTINIPHVHEYKYTYTWSDDNTKCTATRKCINCGDSDSETVDATATVTQKKTCTMPELTKYAATFKNASNNGFESRTKENVQTAEAAGHTIGDWIVDKAATIEATGSRHKECTVCGAILEKEEIKKLEPQEYKIIDGANSTLIQNTDVSIVIRGNGEFSKFKEVKTDGVVIDSRNYTVTEGSTIVTLKADYLKTLSTGRHTFEIVWTDGSVSTNFTVVKNTSDDSESDDDKGNNNNPAQTGDTSNPPLWIALFVASLAGLARMLVKGKRKDCE